MNLAKLQHGMMKNIINRLEINVLKIMNFVDTNMRAMIMTHQWNIKIRM